MKQENINNLNLYKDGILNTQIVDHLIKTLKTERIFKLEEAMLNKLKEIGKGPIRSKIMQTAIPACRYVQTKLQAIKEVDINEDGAIDHFTNILKTEKNNTIAIEIFFRIRDEVKEDTKRLKALGKISSTACCSFIKNYAQRELEDRPIIVGKKQAPCLPNKLS